MGKILPPQNKLNDICDDDIRIAACGFDEGKLITFAKGNRDLAVGTDILKFRNADAFDKTFPRCEEECVRFIFFSRKHTVNLDPLKPSKNALLIA